MVDGDTKLTFTSVDWNTRRIVDYQALHDIDADDNDYTITLDVISGQADYVALDNKELTGTIIDDDAHGFTISPTALNISEGAPAGRDFTVVLDTVPLTSVELTVHTASSQLSLNKATLTFTAGNWTIAQTVNVVGEEDDYVTGVLGLTITVGVIDANSHADYVDVPDEDVPVTFIDNEPAANIVTDPDSSLADLVEGGSSINVQVSLADPPAPTSEDVVLTVTSSDPTAATVVPSRLTFTSANALINQDVAVSPVDDIVVDGNQDYTITVAVVTTVSNDAFDAAPDQTLNGVVTDDDVAGFTLAPAGGAATLADLIEGSATTIFTVVLNAQPLSDVVFDVSKTGPDVTVSPARLTFIPGTWSTAQNVTVTSRVDNDNLEDTASYTVTVSVNDGASDNAFDSLVDQILSGTVTDNDTASFTLTPSDGSSLPDLEEGSNTQIFTVVLDKIPTSAVVFDVSKTGPDASVSPARLTFAPGTWNSAQNVTVTSRADNNVLDGDAAYTVTVSVNAGASDNAFDLLPDQTLNGMVTDDDVAGFTLAPVGGAATLAAISEVGSTTFTALLDRAPLTNVTLSVSSTDTGEATVSVETLVFTNTDWGIAQTVSVVGVADNVVDGIQSYMISVAVVTADSDASHSDVVPQQLRGQVTDAEVASFTLTPFGGAATLAAIVEGENTTTFAVVLGARPLGAVVFDVSKTGDGVTVSPTRLTFAPGNWNTAQNVNVTSRIDNNVLDGDAAYTVTVSVDDNTSDNFFDPLPDQTLNGMVTDDDVAGFTLAPAGGAATLAAISESGSTTFTALLDRAPLTNVTLAVSSTDPGEATVSVPTLVFTNTDWNIAQTVSVNGVADNVVDGIQSYMISVAVATGSDASHSDVLPQQLSGRVTDVDVASFTLTPFGGAATLAAIAEGENTTTFAVVLGARPLGAVVFDVSKTGDDVTVSPTRLTFAPGNWNTAQNVNVTSRIDNNVLDGDAAYTVTVSVDDNTSDNFFDPLPDQTLNGMVTDDDVAGFTLAPVGGAATLAAISESGSTTFTALLDRAPLTNVTLAVSSTDPGEATVSVPTLVFTNTDWNIAQTVSVNGVADSVVDGTQNYVIAVAVATGSDASYSSVGAQQLSGQVTDAEVASFTLTPLGGAATLAAIAEGENTTTFAVVLGARPLSAVVFDVSTTGDDVTVSPARLTFAPGTWNTAQNVNVTSRIDNNVLDGDAAYTVTVSVDDNTSDNFFDPLPDQTLNGMVTDDDVAGFTLAPVGGATTLAAISESGSTSTTTTTFTALLDRAPLTNVTLAVSSTDPGEATVSVPTLVFTNTDWNIAQTVSVNGVADNVVDGIQSYMISVAVVTADSDASHSDVVPQQLRGQVTDAEVASFTLTPFGGAATLAAIVEGENTTTFAVVLGARPLGAVVFDVSKTGDGVTVSPTRLTFAPGNWNTAQNVNVTSRIDNNVLDGDAAYTVTVSVDDNTSDNFFDPLPDQTLNGMVTDDDVAGFTLAPAGGAATLAAISESGSTTFTALLDRAPLTNVTLAVSSTDPDEATVSVSTLVFSSITWDTAQTVSVDGVADSVVDGTQNYVIAVAVATGSDASYSSVVAQQLRGQVTDAEVASFTLTPFGGAATLAAIVEGENTTTFAVVLGARPLDTVVFDVSKTGDDVTVSPTRLTFAPGTWNTAQNVNVTSRIENNVLDGDAAYTVTVSVDDDASDNFFDPLPDQTLTGMVTDDDVAGFTLVPAGGSTLACHQRKWFNYLHSPSRSCTIDKRHTSSFEH